MKSCHDCQGTIVKHAQRSCGNCHVPICAQHSTWVGHVAWYLCKACNWRYTETRRQRLRLDPDEEVLCQPPTTAVGGKPNGAPATN